MLSLHQRLAQTQKLSPQQIQYQKLLQLNTMALEQRIKTELELNPILEEMLEDEIEQLEETDDSADEVEEVTKEDEFEIEDLMNESDLDDNRINKSRDDDEQTQPLAPSKKSLTEQLIEQLHLLDLVDEEMILCEILIGFMPNSIYIFDLY